MTHSNSNSNSRNPSFSIPIASPKYQQFASLYLNKDGSLRESIQTLLLSRPHIKGVRVAYDFDQKQWCLDVLTDHVNVVAKDNLLAQYPCRILTLDAAFPHK